MSMKKTKPSNDSKAMYIVTFQGSKEYTKNIALLFGLDVNAAWATSRTSHRCCYGFVGNGTNVTKGELREKMKGLTGSGNAILDLGVTVFSDTKESENKKIVVSMRLKDGKVREEINAHWEHEVNPFNMG